MVCNYLISKNITSIYVNTATIPKELGWAATNKRTFITAGLVFRGGKQKEKILLTFNSWYSQKHRLFSAKYRAGFLVSLILLELELEGDVVAG